MQLEVPLLSEAFVNGSGVPARSNRPHPLLLTPTVMHSTMPARKILRSLEAEQRALRSTRVPPKEVLRSARELQQGVQADGEQVLWPLLRRIADWSERLRGGVRVPAPAIREGVRLVRSYHEHVHLRRVKQLRRLCGIEPVPALGNASGELMDEPRLAHQRLNATRTALSDYRNAFPGAGARLARALGDEIIVEVAWHESTMALAVELVKRAAEVALPRPDLTTLHTGLRASESARTIERTRVEVYRAETENLLRSPLRPVTGRAAKTPRRRS